MRSPDFSSGSRVCFTQSCSDFSSSRLAEALYVALVAGAAIVLAFAFLFGVDNKALQFTMTFLIAAMMGLLFGTIVCLDRPYSGPLRVSPTAWTLVIENNDLARYRSLR